jgi:predicted RNA binding protein YcfA (HicA-like mRNA interferase family)
MGKLPLLTLREVEANLRSLGFVFKNQVGSHKQYEKAATATRKRAVVTVDVGYPQFSKDGMKRMIRQSLYSKEEFCSGVAKDTAPSPLQFKEAAVVPKTGKGGKN